VTDDAPKAKAPAARRPAAKKPAAAAVTPAEAAAATPAPASPAAAVAPAGWYPVSAGSAQQRWWDGTRWTDHVYDPATATPAAAAATTTTAAAIATPATIEPLRAPAGVKPGTVWFWLLVVGAPVLQSLLLIPVAIYLNQILGGNLTDANAIVNDEFSPMFLVVTLAGWVIEAFCIVFAVLDWRELRKHGVPNPFHWAWSFFVLALGWPVVYVIGRTVVAKRRTGSGLAPLWVFIALEVVAFIVDVVFVFYVFIQFLNALNDGLAAAGNVF
jgi:hypothetical protein